MNVIIQVSTVCKKLSLVNTDVIDEEVADIIDFIINLDYDVIHQIQLSMVEYDKIKKYL